MRATGRLVKIPGQIGRHLCPLAQRDRRGQSLVEFAVVLPLILLMLLGVLDFGRAIVDYVALEQSAHEGARSGIFTTATDGDIRDSVRSHAFMLGDLPDSSISISPAYPRQSGDMLEVVVVYDFSAIAPYFNALWAGGTLRLRGFSRVRVE